MRRRSESEDVRDDLEEREDNDEPSNGGIYRLEIP